MKLAIFRFSLASMVKAVAAVFFTSGALYLAFAAGLVSAMNWGIALAAAVAQLPSAASTIFPGMRLSAIIGPPVGVATGTKCAALAPVLSYIAPVRLSEAVRPLYLAATAGLSPGRGITAIALERFIDIMIVLMLALATILLVGADAFVNMNVALGVLGLVFLVGVAGLVALGLFPIHAVRLTRRLPFRWLRIQAREVLKASRRSVSIAPMLRAVTYGIAAWICSYLIFLVFFAIGGAHPLSATDVLIVFLISAIGLSIAVLPAGLGTFEGAIVLTLMNFGYTLQEGTVAALALRLTIIIAPALIFSYMVFFDRFQLRAFFSRPAASQS